MQSAEQQALAEDIAKRVRECGVPAGLIESDMLTPDTLPDDVRPTWTAARDLVEHYAGAKSIVALIGTHGTGKSTIGAAAVLRTCKAQGVARYVVAWDYLARYDAASKRNLKETSEKVEESFCRPPLLVIDELHQQQPLFGELNLLALRRLVLRRWDCRLCTVLISNDGDDTFEHRVGEAIVSRMHQSGASMNFDYTDLRRRLRESAA